MHSETAATPQRTLVPNVPPGALPVYLPRRPMVVLGISSGARIGLALWTRDGSVTGWTLPDLRLEGRVSARRAAEMIANAIDLCDPRPDVVAIERPTIVPNNWRTVMEAGQAGARLAAEQHRIRVVEVERPTIAAMMGLPPRTGGRTMREALRRAGLCCVPDWSYHTAIAAAAAWFAGLSDDARAARNRAAAATFTTGHQGRTKANITPAPKARTKRKPLAAAGMPKPKTKAQLAAMRARKVATRKGASQ